MINMRFYKEKNKEIWHIEERAGQYEKGSLDREWFSKMLSDLKDSLLIVYWFMLIFHIWVFSKRFWIKVYVMFYYRRWMWKYVQTISSFPINKLVVMCI